MIECLIKVINVTTSPTSIPSRGTLSSSLTIGKFVVSAVTLGVRKRISLAEKPISALELPRERSQNAIVCLCLGCHLCLN
jgi:hypothetical protein